jgi:hypothetical protein
MMMLDETKDRAPPKWAKGTPSLIRGCVLSSAGFAGRAFLSSKMGSCGVYPDLVARGADGQIETVRYQLLVPGHDIGF